MEITYQQLGTSQVKELTCLIRLYEEVFDMKDFVLPDTACLQSLLAKETTFFITACVDHKVVGGLTAHILPSTYSSVPEVYIYDLAVQTSFQRKGIGRGLIHALKEFCKSSGIKEIFVQADLEDQHAIDFYKATGGIAEEVIHFSYDTTR